MSRLVSYPSIDIPKIVPFLTSRSSQVVVSDNYTIQKVTVDLAITSPDEGTGPDASLLAVYLLEQFSNGSIVQITLQNGSLISLASTNFDNVSTPFMPMASFNGFSSLATWNLSVFNYSSDANATINSWTLNLTYPNFPNGAVPAQPIAPVGKVLPIQKYGIGGNIRKNEKLSFTLPVVDGTNTLITSNSPPKLVPFNCTVEDIMISMENGGTTTTGSVTLHRVSNGVDSILITQPIDLSLTWNNYLMPLNNPTKILNKNDVIYISLDVTNSNLSYPVVQVTLNERY